MSRTAKVHRATKETSIDLDIDIDGSGVTDISTGIPFYDHMLEQVGKHGGFDLRIAATGDLHIDTHHTVEDVAISLGEAFRQALGDKAGVRRFASGLYPLDEALVEVALDLSGRPFVVWEVDLPECLPLGNPAFDPQLPSTPLRRSPLRQASRCTSRCAAGATCTTSSKQSSRDWRGVSATRCASRARRYRRRRACSDQ